VDPAEVARAIIDSNAYMTLDEHDQRQPVSLA
jgi:hypothetical protein